MRTRHVFSSLVLLAALGSLVGCGSTATLPADGADDYNALFGPPSTPSATGDRMLGLWGGSGERNGTKYDMRFRFEKDRTTLAGRCTFSDGTTLTVGASAASRIAEKSPDEPTCFPLKIGGPKPFCGELQILESASRKVTAGERFCSVDLKPTAFGYTLSGMQMRLSAAADQLDLIKVSD